MLISSLCLQPVNLSRSRITFFYHVSDQLQRAYSYVAFYIYNFSFQNFSIWQLGVYLPPVQPYNSALIEMCLFQVTGRKRIYNNGILIRITRK